METAKERAAILTFAIIRIAAQIYRQSKAESEITAISRGKFHWQLENKLDSLSNLFDDQIILQHASGMIQSKDEYL